MINPEINDRTIGFLFLLFILLVLYSLKPIFDRSRSYLPPCDEHLFIQIEGDIKTPGVYPFCHQPNLMDLIGRAGGLSYNDLLPERLKDHPFHSDVRVVVQKKGDGWKLSQTEMSAFYKITLGILISLNRESENGLTAIPGIGVGLAKTIVEERTKRGGFKSLNEIMSITGIGHRSYRKIVPYLTL